MHRIAKGFFTGINYWGSKDATHMWEHFDAAEIEKDFQVLRDCGITHLRVFPLWPVFQPLKALYGPQEVYEYGLGEEKLPVLTQYFYTPESYTAEPLAFCDTGAPVFFRHRLGKGWVYLLTLPLERHLSALPGAFFEEGVAPYHRIYRELAKAAGVDRLCDSDHPYIRLTEHPMDENSSYIFAINYSNKPATAQLSLKAGYTICQTLYGTPAQDGILSIPMNDGVLFVVSRN